MKISILLVDDHKILRDGIKMMLSQQDEVHVIGEAESGMEACKLVKSLKPQLVLMDLSMPDFNGIQTTLKIKQTNPDIKILVLSMHSEKKYVERAFDAGVSGYLLKDCAFNELSFAINTVVSGKVYISPSIAELLIDGYVQSEGKSNKGQQALSSREQEVLQFLAEGYSTNEIAKTLFLSSKTIESHRKNIMDKLDIHNVAGLTKYAIKEGLVIV